ncbi:MAG: flagellar filament capping protein FliD [Thermoguttaceae bacterium]|jgi:flagellar hook-associated protein 2|nr:flagellar filament capping protein FliD [Thermoguttaceae bacterium]
MGRIQTNIGLITGVPIMDLVNQLMELSAVNRDRLASRTDELREEQMAVATLGSLIYATRVSVNALGRATTYQQLKANSSNDAALAATLTGTPARGIYEFTPLQMAQSQKLLSSGFKSATDPIGAGSITVRFGDHVERGASLSLINNGAGLTRGRIRIGDRSGAWAEIDLSTARTIDDVLDAINGSSAVNVTATTRDGRIVLTDDTGLANANLRVLEVGGGRTAESLGLGAIDAAAPVAEGANIYGLFGDFDLAMLNDGAGVAVDNVLPDIKFTLRDGTVGNIDFSPSLGGDPEVDDTIDKIIARIHKDSDGKLEASIAPDGRRLVVTDTTEGDYAFSFTALYNSQAMADLGLDNAPVDGVITGNRILGGLRTVVLSSLNGGKGFGGLGLIELTSRSGGEPVTVDLSGAETLEDLIDAINAAGASIRAQVNRARNGIELVDTSGGTAGNLIIADADETNTATKLNIAADTSLTMVDSGDMHLQVISRNTVLTSLNGGAGVARGQFRITDSNGLTRTVDLRLQNVKTMGDVIDAINRLYLGATAELNATGDGILLRDTAGGAGTLTVTEAGGTTARDLGLLKNAANVEVDGQSQQHIDGSTTHTIAITANDSLDSLASKINTLGAGFSASVLSDGSPRPWRLSLASDRAGQSGSLVIDTSAVAFDLSEISKGQDAMLAYGPASAAASAVLVTSSNNTFDNIVNGLSLQIQQATGATVSVSVEASYATATAAAKGFVENYNRFRDELTALTKYDPEAGRGSILTGDAAALRMDTDMTRLVTSRFLVGGQFEQLSQVGINFNDTGKLSFDESKFNAALAANPQAVEQLFATKDTGVAARLEGLIEQLAGEETSLLARRLEALDGRIADNESRIGRMDASLDRERTRMLTQFYNMELAVARIQNNLNALDSIAWITDQYRRTDKN